MTDEEFAGRLGELYDMVMKSRNDDDYVVNQPQMNKLVDVISFFIDTAKKCNGHVEPINIFPREQRGGVTASFIVFHICGDDIARFCKVMSYTSAISIDESVDGVCISVTVPDVFVPKNQ